MRFLPLTILIGLLFATSVLPAQRRATILDHKDRIRIQRVDVLNSRHRETNLSITPDGKYLYFMSLRGGQFWSEKFMQYKSDSVYDGDIWYAERRGGQWMKPQAMPYGVNTESGEDEPNITKNGSTVYYQSWNYRWRETGGPYYRASRIGTTWSRSVGLGGGIHEFFKSFRATDGMSISNDEKTFVVAAGRDYNTPMDLYISKRTRYGWTYCKKLALSTRGDERSAFLAADGKTLYFASDGYSGFGGLDIYKATINDDGTVGEVINVGKPFNTAGDDYGLIITGDGSEAYFVRNGDIHFADLKDADERIKPEGVIAPESVNLTLIGTVKDKKNWKGLPAQVVLVDARTKIPVKSVRTQADGSYRIVLPNKSKAYKQVVKSDGYEQKVRTISIEAQPRNETFQQNYLLAKEEEEVVEPPVIASSDPDPPAPDPTPAEPSTPTEPETVQTEEQPQVPEPDPEPVEEDPYSFEGVAENHLILLLDVSESMKEANRLPLLKQSLAKLLDYMRTEDRISVIIYSGEVKTIVENMSTDDRDRIISKINELSSGGTSMGRSGLLTAYSTALKFFRRGGNNRIIMATDGEFNIDPLMSIAEANAKRDVALSVFSFDDTNATKLSKLAQKGQGNYARITPKNVDMALLKEAKAVRKK